MTNTKAIRKCPLVGKGSDSFISEAFSDSEIREAVASLSVGEALRWAHDAHEDFLEQMGFWEESKLFRSQRSNYPYPKG